MDDLKLKLKQIIIHAANLEDVTPEEIDDAAPLFVEGLGLDSIDALELSVALDVNFGINISDSETAKAAFQSIDTLAAFVTEHRKK